MPAFVIGCAPSYGGCDWPSDINSGTPISIGDNVSGTDLVTGERASGTVSAVTFVFDGAGMTAHAIVEDLDGTRHDMGGRPVLIGPFSDVADAMERQ